MLQKKKKKSICTHSMVSMLTLSNVSRCAWSNSSWYLSILSAFSQSPTVATAVRSVGVGLSSGWEQLLPRGAASKNGNMRIHKYNRLLTARRLWCVFCCLTELAPPWARQGAWWAGPRRTAGIQRLACPLDQPASTEASGSGGQRGSCAGRGDDTGPPRPSSPAATERQADVQHSPQVGQTV